MKSLHILTASAVALASFAFAGTALSQTVVRISGATTYRAPVTQAILDSLDSGYTFAYDSSTTSATAIYGAGAAIFKGTLNVSGHPAVIIKTYFTGSLAGVVDLAQQNNITKWLPNGVTTSAAPGTNVNGTGYTAESAPCQATLSDAFATTIASSVATAAAPQGKAASKLIKSLTFVDAGATAGGLGTVGVVPFAWVLGKIAATGVPTYTYTALNTSGSATTNSNTVVPFGSISQSQAAALVGGPTPLTLFTGNAADQNKFVLLIGRNEDSGTRIAAFAEAQTGFGNGTTQFQLTFSGSTITANGSLATGGTAATITGGAAWPADYPLNTNANINWKTLGHSGYTTGGDVGNVLKATNPVLAGSLNLSNVPTNLTHAYFAGYLGIADASGVTGGTILNYNGVPYSVANTQNGLYSFWSFEHLYYLGNAASGAISGTAKTAVDTIADKIFTTDADLNSSGAHAAANAAGIFYDSNFLVSRPVEGGVLFGNYY